MTTLVRFREPLRNVAMNGEFERLIRPSSNRPPAPLPSPTAPGHLRLTSGRPRASSSTHSTFPAYRRRKSTSSSRTAPSQSAARASAASWRMGASSATSVLRRVHALCCSTRGD